MRALKKWFALLCALALTLTLCPAAPARAGDNLNPAAAVAFYSAASLWGEENFFVYAALRDMDSDGQPELAAVTIPKENASDWKGGNFPYFFSGHCVVWKYIPGVGLRRFAQEASTGQLGDILWARKGDALYIHIFWGSAHQGYVYGQESYLGASGLADCVSWSGPITSGEEEDGEAEDLEDTTANRIVNGREEPISSEELVRISSAYEDESESLLEAEDWDGASHCADYAALESRLRDTARSVSAAPSATWGACRLDTEDNDTWIVFECAKAERKVVSVNAVISSMDANGNFYDKESGYQTKTVTVAQARAGSYLIVCGGDEEVSHDVFYDGGSVEGEGRFRTVSSELGSESFMGGPIRHLLSCKERGLMCFSERDGMDCIVYADPGDALDAYTDVNPDGYYAVPVTWGIQQGITNGTTATTFSPNNTCSRAHILTFLWRACGSPTPYQDNPFTDVPANSYYYQAALWAAENGLVRNEGEFNGGAPCSRAEAVTYLWKLSGDEYADGVTDFTDVQNGTDIAKAVQWAVECGVTNGTTATTFSPNNTCTRAQIMTFLYRDYYII